MNNATIFRQIIYFFLYVIIQIFLAKNLALFGMAFCFVYIGFLLILPLDLDKALLIFIGFVLGLLVDSFYDTLGFHTAACVLIAYLRSYIVSLLAERETQYVSIHQTGWAWFATYSLPLILIHHLFIFFVEIGSFDMLGLTIAKILSSTLFTFILIVATQFLFISNKN